MTYIDGFVIPVAPGKKEAYRKMTAEVAPFFMEYGALEIVECFEDDVPDGKATDFRRVVDAEEGEKLVFSWIVWPSRELRDDGPKRLMEDQSMKSTAEMPFDCTPQIFDGFTPTFPPTLPP